MRVTVEAETNEFGVPRIDYVVRVSSSDDTAKAGSDYEGVDERLRFAEGDFETFVNDIGLTRYRQTKYFDVVILDDGSAVDTEGFQLNLSKVPGYQGLAFGVQTALLHEYW